MTAAIVNIIFEKCGTCHFAQVFKADHMAECYGHPPSVHIVGAAKNVLGQPGLQLETFVPRVNRERPACALYRPKQDFATEGNS